MNNDVSSTPSLAMRGAIITITLTVLGSIALFFSSQPPIDLVFIIGLPFAWGFGISFIVVVGVMFSDWVYQKVWKRK